MTNLITIAYLTDTCFLSENINAKKFQSLLEMAQDDLKNILQRPLYDEILAQYSTVPTSLSTANGLLYPYIQKFIAWQTNFYFQKFADVNSTPTGNREFKEENSDLLSDVKNFALEKNIRERANNYKNEMINFLKEARINNALAYPLWVDKCQEEFSFAISSVSGKSETRTEIFKSTRYNE